MKLSCDHIAILAATGKVKVIPREELILRACKLDGVRLPPFWAEVTLLASSLRKAWASSSKDLGNALKGIITGDEQTSRFHADKWEEVQKLYDETGRDFADAVRPKTQAISILVSERANKAFSKQLAKTKTEPISSSSWDSWLQAATMNHVTEFSKTYPGRILDPQIRKQLEDIAASPDKHSTMDLFRVKQRLDRIYTSDPYFDNMPSIEVSRLWHATGIMMAHEKGIAAYQIINPMDKRTCPVCLRLHGQVYQVEDVLPKVKAWGDARGADEIAALFPFPRMNDVARDANPTLEDLKSRGFNLPPFHGRCRDEIHYLWRDKTLVQTENIQIEPPAPKLPTTDLPMPAGWSVDSTGYVSFPQMTQPDSKAWLELLLERRIVGDDSTHNITKQSAENLNKAFGLLAEVAEHAPLRNPLTELKFLKQKGTIRGWYADERYGAKYAGPTIQLDNRPEVFSDIKHLSPADEQLQTHERIAADWKRKIEQREVETVESLKERILKKYTSEFSDSSQAEQFARRIFEQRQGELTTLRTLLEEAESEVAKIKQRIDAGDLSTIRSRGPLASEAKTWGASRYGDNPAQGYAVHEYGHAWHAQHEDVVADFFESQFGTRLPKHYYSTIIRSGNIKGARFVGVYADLAPTQYAETTLAEVFAENFTLYMMGQVNTMNPAFVKFFDEQFPNLSFGRRLIPEIYV